MLSSSISFGDGSRIGAGGSEIVGRLPPRPQRVEQPFAGGLVVGE